MIARKKETLSAAAGDLDATKISCASIAADTGSETELRTALSELKASLGDPQILIYNALTDHRVASIQLALENAIADFRVNVGGALVAAQAVASGMIAKSTRRARGP